MEIKNKLTVTRSGRRIVGERRGKGKQKNTNRGLMGMDNVRINCGSGGKVWGAMGKKVEQLSLNNNKKNDRFSISVGL